MEGYNHRPRALQSFSDRINHVYEIPGLAGWKAEHFQGLQPPPDDETNFRWRIDGADFSNDIPYQKQPQDEGDNTSDHSTSPNHRKTLLMTLIWPVSVIVLPILLLSAVLLGMVFGFRVHTAPSLFQSPASPDLTSGGAYLLVNYSATRLVFLASWLSTLAPILASFVMVLWSLRTARTIRAASDGSHYTHLPTPYQLSLVVGLTLASTERLRRYIGYVFSKNSSSIPPVLHHAALMLALSVLLAIAVFLGDTALHYTTNTVQFDQVVAVPQPSHAFGRGLSTQCLNFNRTSNFCYPCTLDLEEEQEVMAAQSNEAFFLQHNTSTQSEIRIIGDDTLKNGDLAILTPQAQNLPRGIEYRGSTIGVSTQCLPISSQCNMWANGVDGTHTQFNCSANFFGLLGKAPNISEIYTKAQDPDVPPLDWKPSPNLQYGYFSDPQLNVPYNTIGYNPQTGDPDPDLPCMSDDQLVNPVYLGVAGRFSVNSESAGSNLTHDTGLWHGAQNPYVDFILNCAYTTYDVNYTWVNGAVADIIFSPSPNGSVAEMYHGSRAYTTVTGGAYDLQDAISLAALADTSHALAAVWANQHSIRVLADIGALTTTRTNLAEQVRTPMLVAKISQIALAVLVGCSLAYALLGLVLAVVAYRASSVDVRDLAARLSLAGLTAAAFDDTNQTTPHNRNRYRNRTSKKEGNAVFDETEAADETRRVGITGDERNGYRFKVWV